MCQEAPGQVGREPASGDQVISAFKVTYLMDQETTLNMLQCPANPEPVYVVRTWRLFVYWVPGPSESTGSALLDDFRTIQYLEHIQRSLDMK